MKITYLLNSGFLVRLEHTLLVFDDFRDPQDSVRAAIESGGFDRLYFFASHSHFDHFDAQIGDFARYTERYILSDDIRRAAGSRVLPQTKIVWMPEYDKWQDDHIKVRSFSSTDLGTSFLVEVKDVKLFHAGDFNWWDWIGDYEENRKMAANGFHKQLARMQGLDADVAFFPVDGRLEESMDKGAKAFCAATDVKSLVTMHSVGYPVWEPPADFFAEGREIPVWSPRQPGETRILAVPVEKGARFTVE